jgi:hypothetical protein
MSDFVPDDDPFCRWIERALVFLLFGVGLGIYGLAAVLFATAIKVVFP